MPNWNTVVSCANMEIIRIVMLLNCHFCGIDQFLQEMHIGSTFPDRWRYLVAFSAVQHQLNGYVMSNIAQLCSRSWNHPRTETHTFIPFRVLVCTSIMYTHTRMDTDHRIYTHTTQLDGTRAMVIAFIIREYSQYTIVYHRIVYA